MFTFVATVGVDVVALYRTFVGAVVEFTATHCFSLQVLGCLLVGLPFERRLFGRLKVFASGSNVVVDGRVVIGLGVYACREEYGVLVGGFVFWGELCGLVQREETQLSLGAGHHTATL